MNIGRAFGFVFRDPRLVPKLAVAALLLLVPVLGWLFVWGYGLRIVRAVVAQTDVPLPEWNGWADLLVDGLRAISAVVVWSLLPTVVFLVPRFVFDAGADVRLLPALAVVLNLAVGVIAAAAVARVAMTRSFVSGIEGGPVIRLVGRGLGDYLLIFLVLMLLTAVFAGVGGVVLAIVWVAALASGSDAGVLAAAVVSAAVAVVAIPYGSAVGFHLFGQAYFRAEPSAWPRAQPEPLERW